MPKKIYIAFIAMLAFLFANVVYSYAIDLPVLHLKNSEISFTDSSINGDIPFYITNSGNSTGIIDYSVTASATNLIDSHNSANKIPITFTTYSNSMNLATKIEDESVSNKITASMTRPTKAGEYSGTTTVTFNSLKITHTVTFNESYDSRTSTRNVVNGAKVGTLPTLTRSHYRFDGWYKESSYINKIDANTVINENTTFYAKWTYLNYITYNLDSGTVATANKTTYVTNETKFKLNNPTRSGYIFAGWTGTGLSERTLNVTIDTTKTQDWTLTANWKQQVTSGWYGPSSNINGCVVKDFLIAYENGPKVTVFLNISGSPSEVRAPTWHNTNQSDIDWGALNKNSWTRSGRTFNYAKNMTNTAKQYYSTHVYITCGGTQRYYVGAGYTISSMYVTYNGNGGTTTAAKTLYDWGWDVSLPTNKSTRSGYTFLGWSTAADGNILTKMRMGGASTTLYVQWAKTSN